MLKLPLPLLLLVALPGRAAPAPASTPVECGARLRNLVLEVGAPAVVVCVAPEVATVLRFDTLILTDRTVLEGGDVSLTSMPTTIYLEATRALAVGERRRLTVYFADGHEPSSATFVLVGQEQGEPRQVNLFRRARTAASLRREAEQQRQRAEVCEQQLAQCHEVAPAGLLGRVLKLGGSNGIP
ncbi:MAG TPA: DUF2381 family protein, partial [Myxococcaceae bacterium]|nr:DUF2381 family protein [Myxococcaceae bacterium]